MNQKYEITDIAHEQYPWLHRVRAKMDISDYIEEGDLGGFVESESNLSIEQDDPAWLFDNSISCGEACVCEGAILRDNAVATDKAYVTHFADLSGDSRAEDNAFVRGAMLSQKARVSGSGMMIVSPDTGYCPEATGRAAIYGKVIGSFFLAGESVVFPGEEFHNDCEDKLWLVDNKRTAQRDTCREELKPKREQKRSRQQSR